MSLTERILAALAGGEMTTQALCRALGDVPVQAVMAALDGLWADGAVDGGWPSPSGPWRLPRVALGQLALTDDESRRRT